MVDTKKLTKMNALVVLDAIWNDKKASVAKTADKLKLTGGVSEKDIEKIIAALLAATPKAREDYKATPDKVINFMVGRIMKETGGKADSALARELVTKTLGA